MPIRILIAEDQRIVREGLIALLEDESEVAIVGEASGGVQARSQDKGNVTLAYLAWCEAGNLDQRPQARILRCVETLHAMAYQGMIFAQQRGYIPNGANRNQVEQFPHILRATMRPILP